MEKRYTEKNSLPSRVFISNALKRSINFNQIISIQQHIFYRMWLLRPNFHSLLYKINRIYPRTLSSNNQLKIRISISIKAKYINIILIIKKIWYIKLDLSVICSNIGIKLGAKWQFYRSTHSPFRIAFSTAV